MNSPILGLRVASVVFGVICLGQLFRIVMDLQVLVAGHLVGRRWSAIVVIITGALCAWLWKLACPKSTPAAEEPQKAPQA
ncbi:MAG: hypothetical protein WC378_08985 [Opitutaceae bacterium]|jgi:hypothetical protein